MPKELLISGGCGCSERGRGIREHHTPRLALAASASEINAKVTNALVKLYKTEPGSKALVDKPRGGLLFPDIVEGGFIVAGQYGDDAPRKGER